MIFNILTYENIDMKTLFENNVMVLQKKINGRKYNKCTQCGMCIIIVLVGLLLYKYKHKQNKFKTNNLYTY
jgi:uncharacterized membrane protein